MAYTSVDFKTKKALKEAVAKWNRYVALKAAAPMTVGAVMAAKAAEPGAGLPKLLRRMDQTEKMIARGAISKAMEEYNAAHQIYTKIVDDLSERHQRAAFAKLRGLYLKLRKASK